MKRSEKEKRKDAHNYKHFKIYIFSLSMCNFEGTAMGAAAGLAHSTSDIGKIIEMYSFRSSSWDDVKVIVSITCTFVYF